jgi:S1-C subfamily serine protease
VIEAERVADGEGRLPDLEVGRGPYSLDSAGRLIGVNTAIFSPSGASAGIGFAVPVDVVNRVVPDLIKNGRVRNPGRSDRR